MKLQEALVVSDEMVRAAGLVLCDRMDWLIPEAGSCDETNWLDDTRAIIEAALAASGQLNG